jgi:hypothetical protein
MLSDRLRTFIHTCVKSIWGLELLLYLRAHDDRWWNVAALTRELRASEPVVRGALRLLRTAGLIREDDKGCVQFGPISSELDGLVREMAYIYATHPVEVSEEIYAADRNIQHFADAFRLKKV